MSGHEHHYQARLIWDGNKGEGTSSYTTYGREYRVLVGGKPDLRGTADVAFRGEASKHNPEDLFLAAVSACHMLSYLALCAREGLRVLAYEDDAKGLMITDRSGGGKFEEIVLHPVVTLASSEHTERAMHLHERAHEVCFIANSCSVPIRHHAEVKTA